jgi:hypothetical protein
MSKLDLNQLSDEDKKALLLQLEEQQKAEKEKLASERASYKQLADDAVHAVYPIMQTASETLSEAKEFAFETFKTLIKLKAELYGREEEQNTHTFTSKDGKISITIGYNLTDGWDDTVNTGLAKVQDYIKSLSKNAETQLLVDAVLKLISKDAKGNLKSSRVLQLRQMADKTGDKEFIDAMQIIQDAYRPTRSKEFARVVYKDERGVSNVLPLNISEAPFTKTTTEIPPAAAAE